MDLREAVSSIADSKIPLEEKREKIISLLSNERGRPHDQGDSIEFCTCGYPIKNTFSDGGWGPIFGIVDMEKQGEDWQLYKCPRCAAEIQRLPAP